MQEIDDHVMLRVTSPTADHILTVDANGDAKDSGVAISAVGGASATGSSTGTGSAQTIPHGITVGAGQKLRVTLFPAASGTVFTDFSADGTNIYVTVTNGKDFDWKAEIL